MKSSKKLVVAFFLFGALGVVARQKKPDTGTPGQTATARRAPQFSVRSEVVLRSGPGEESKPLVNQKATRALGEVHHLRVDDTCRVEELDSRDGWSRVRGVSPKRLSSTHVGWMPTGYIRGSAGEATPEKNSSRKPEGKKIPRTMSDGGTYYLLRAEQDGDLIKTLHKRVGPSGVTYTELEIDCRRRRVRELGIADESLDNMVRNATDWFDLVNGSSKSDLADFVCSPTNDGVAATPSPDAAEVIGQWIDEDPHVGGRLTIHRVNGELLLERKFKDGSSLRKILVERIRGGKQCLEEKEGNPHGQYYVVEASGALAMYDTEGLVKRIPGIK